MYAKMHIQIKEAHRKRIKIFKKKKFQYDLSKPGIGKVAVHEQN